MSDCFAVFDDFNLAKEACFARVESFVTETCIFDTETNIQYEITKDDEKKVFVINTEQLKIVNTKDMDYGAT